MRKLSFPIAIAAGMLTLCLSASAEEKTVESVLKAHIEAMGGDEAMDKIKTVKRKADMSMTGVYGPMEGSNNATLVVGEKVFSETDLGLFQEQAGYDGSAGWKNSSAGGLVDLKGNELEAVKGQLELSILARVWRDRGSEAFTLHEDETHEGKTYTVIQIEGEEGKFYLDQESHLIAGTAVPFEDVRSGTSGMVILRYRDYEKYEGVPMANTVITDVANGTINVTLKYTETKINEEVDHAIFKKP